jgi:ribosomal protein S27AE
MTYPRSRNGHVDDGSLIKASNRRDKCPKCGSANYRETLSREECSSCGLVCDYWGGGGNAVYEQYMDNKHFWDRHEAEMARQRELDQEHAEWRGQFDDTQDL